MTTKTILYLLITFSILSCKTQQLAVVKKDGKFGAINRKGTFEIEPIWDYLFLDDYGKPVLVEKDSQYGYISRKGEVIITPRFKDAELFSEDLALVSNSQDKWGYINIEGELIIDYQFEENGGGEFSNGLADVVLNEKCGYINKKGQIQIPLVYENCYPFISDIAVVMDTLLETYLINKKGELLAYNDKNIAGNKIFPPRDTYPGSFKTNKGQGRLSSKGDTVVPPLYAVTGNLSDNMYIVKEYTGKWGAYNHQGKLAIPPQFDQIRHFHEGYANFEINNKWGFVSKKGLIVIDPKFDYAVPFHNGLSYVELNGKAGFINKKGKTVIPIIYELDPSSFE
jgi:hypothetical protein